MGKSKKAQEDQIPPAQQSANRVNAVLHLLKNQAPLTVKQDKFCSNACVERFLRAKGDNVKRAAKYLRNCLNWRDTVGADSLIADEFTAELVDGVAYVAGRDAESRPVLIFRVKQDYFKSHAQTQKRFTRLVVFTLEVAIHSMAKKVDQFVILFDSSFFKSGSIFMSMVVSTLKIIAEYYPCRLRKAFIIDPPALFPYLWKGMKPFLELTSSTQIVSSLDYEDQWTQTDLRHSCRRTLFDSDKHVNSSRFTFTVSHHFDSLKPWYLSFTEPKVGTMDQGPELSPLSGRSLSFASPVGVSARKVLFPLTPMPEKARNDEALVIRKAVTPKPSFLRSPAGLFSRLSPSKTDGIAGDLFGGYMKFYRRPYDEMSYRSKMRSPLSGLISIVSQQIRSGHVSVSQRF